uniref:Uncharacterized protein 17E5.345 n=1 Tax=Neurospora crassa TaxID=5141 RepID=Q96UD1_NEUCS|nr:hypothetical protein [Neurospora crassa]
MFSTDQIRSGIVIHGYTHIYNAGGAEASTAFPGPRAVIGKREVHTAAASCIGEQGQKSKLRSSESQRHLRCETRLCVCRTRDSLRE